MIKSLRKSEIHMKKYTLITGASSGLGIDFANEYAKQNALKEKEAEIGKFEQDMQKMRNLVEEKEMQNAYLNNMLRDARLEIERLKKEGFQFISEEPKDGADNKLVVFLHPKSTNGVLVELCQEKL